MAHTYFDRLSGKPDIHLSGFVYNATSDTNLPNLVNDTKINLLIVDDEVLLRQGLRAMLEKEKFVQQILEADDRDSFIKQIENNRIEIILLDIRLRKTSGLELIGEICCA
ncbi:MAG TPA: response regulator [Chryseosolibacter sp.]